MAIQNAEGGEKQKELQLLIQQIDSLEKLQASDSEVSEVDTLSQQIKVLSDLISDTKGTSYKRLYDLAKEIMQADEADDFNQCILCDSALSFSLKSHVESQLDQYQEISNKTTEARQYWNTSTLKSRLKNLEKQPTFNIGRRP